MSPTDCAQGVFSDSDYRMKHLRAQAASGLSVAAYCRRLDLCAATFYHWRRLHRQCGEERADGGAVLFTEIGRVASVQSRWAAEITLASGVVVRVSPDLDSRLLRTLLEVLG